MIRRLAFSVSLFVFAVLLGSCGKKTPTLNLLVWEGYADPSFVHELRRKVSLQGFRVLHGIE